MKKLLIVNNNLDMGGIQKSLVNLVKEVHREYDISLLLFSKSGLLLSEIPENVNIITLSKVYSTLGLDKKSLKKQRLLFALKAFLLAYSKIFSRRSAMKLIGLFQKKISGYDTVIAWIT
ncbi:MAG: glycosyltransferase [Ruminococcaceae bacterium]|nr:glycosyltransferase [Oscillospiraceae bacterium]